MGLAIDYAGLDAVKMLFWSAVVNGLLAPPLILLVVLLNQRPQRDGGSYQFAFDANSRLVTFIITTAAAAGLLLYLIYSEGVEVRATRPISARTAG